MFSKNTGFTFQEILGLSFISDFLPKFSPNNLGFTIYAVSFVTENDFT